MHTKKLLAVLAPMMSFSLTLSAFAGNEPVSTPAKTPVLPNAAPAMGANQRGVTGGVMDRPEMAPFKRIQMFAMKFRQKLSNLQVILDQAKRVNSISESEYKKLQKELDHLNEVEPSLARGGWKDSDIAAFEKEIATYQAHFERKSPGAGIPAQISDPVSKSVTKDAGTATKDAAASKTKSSTTSPKK